MQPDRQSGMLQAITPEDQNQLDYVGGEASAPDDKGLVPDEDQNPSKDPTPEQLAAEGAGDMELLPEEAGQ